MKTTVDRVKRHLSLEKLRQRLSRSRLARSPLSSTSSEEEYLHLLEDEEPIDGATASSDTQKNVETTYTKGWMSSTVVRLTTTKSSSTSSSGNKEDSSGISKYDIPSSIIILTKEERQELETVLYNIACANVGLS